jgi:hypothetical protein
MKKIVLLVICAFVLFACSSKKGYLDRNDADRSLQEAVKKINKNPDDEKATEAIPQLYNLIKKKHLDQIAAYNQSQQLNKWDNIVNEYEYLQAAYNAIMNAPAAFKLVNPESYSTNIVEANESGAAAYYENGNSFFDKPGRDNAKAAYAAYKKAGKFVPGYKDINEKMQKAYENAIINVIINPVQDNSFFSNNGWGNYGMNYSNEYFQQNLLRDLSNYGRNPAKYYNQWDARRLNVTPDWTVDFRINSVLVPNPQTSYSSRTVNKQLQIGTDTAGRPVYNNVSATINITRTSFISRANMEVNITDLITRKNMSYRNYNEEYKWEQESATFSGDRRAISQRDWDMINNSGLNAPRKEEILVGLYKKIYPQVLSQIRMAVNW